MVSVVYRQIEVPASGLSLEQRRPTDCGVSECHCDASIKGRLWSTRVCHAMEEGARLKTT